MDKPKDPRGGAGRGQGRKPLYSQKTTKVAVTLLPDQVEAMKKLGNGNLSAGIRKAIEILNYLDQIAPLADDTCTEPGITLSEAVRRALAEK